MIERNLTELQVATTSVELNVERNATFSLFYKHKILMVTSC
jgi:hypothetical protein